MLYDELKTSHKTLTVFKLVMMAVVAIDSLKNLPASAQYGTSLLLYYSFAIVTFFIPSALVSAELATSLPQNGGVYIWVREAFGKHMAFLTVWIQWVIVTAWFPTILSFIAVTLVYSFAPSLADNKIYVLTVVTGLFWLAIFLICKGIEISSKISTFCAIIGVIIPMAFIIVLGIIWVSTGKASQIHFSLAMNNEGFISSDHFRLFITLLYSLMGMEMIAAHAGDVKNPQKGYPKALVISAFIILATIIPASLAIAIVVPSGEIGLTTGINQAFIALLKSFNLTWMTPYIITAIAIGSFGIFYNWFLTPSRCLLIAAQDNNFPRFLQQTNKNGMPSVQLTIQGVIFTLICAVFILMPSVNSAFWLLTAACAQLGLIYYLFIFASAIRLRYTQPDLHRPFKVGKGPLMMWILCVMAMTVCTISIFFGFLPPPDLDRGHFIL